MQVLTEFNRDTMGEVAAMVTGANKPVALTGAGISVGSGIPDFRSQGGLWSIFAPDEYATLDVFRADPGKAWELYRALGKVLLGKQPNSAHHALSRLEGRGCLSGIITQNVDNLHQQAGSHKVYEIHGDHQHLQCLQCENVIPVQADHYAEGHYPRCGLCEYPLKPNVVLFGEAVRSLDSIFNFLYDCDLLLVIGTSAQVYPAAGIPSMVKESYGKVLEFNQEPSLAPMKIPDCPDYLFMGDVCNSLPLLADCILEKI